MVETQDLKTFLQPSQILLWCPVWQQSLLAAAGITQPAARGATFLSLSSCTYHDAMMELRESSTSEAVRRCCGSKTSSFRIKHTVFSETRPSLGERTRGERECTRRAGAAAGWTCWEHGSETAGATIALTKRPQNYPGGSFPVPAAWDLSHLCTRCPSSATASLVATAYSLCSHYCCNPRGL